jgi:hypothetical protein
MQLVIPYAAPAPNPRCDLEGEASAAAVAVPCTALTALDLSRHSCQLFSPSLGLGHTREPPTLWTCGALPLVFNSIAACCLSLQLRRRPTCARARWMDRYMDHSAHHHHATSPLQPEGVRTIQAAGGRVVITGKLAAFTPASSLPSVSLADAVPP